MKYKFIIPGTMPNLNDYIHGERVSFWTKNGKFMTKGSQMKAQWQKKVVTCIRLHMRGAKVNMPVNIHYHYFEPDRRRDKGNIHAFVQKVVEDALQDAKVLPNDGWNEINDFSAEFDVDKLNPRIEVTLTEVG